MIFVNIDGGGCDRLLLPPTAPGARMMTFMKMHELRAFQRRRLAVLHSIEDLDVVVEIGYHEDIGHPLTLKRLFLQKIGSIATVRRLYRRMEKLLARA